METRRQFLVKAASVCTVAGLRLRQGPRHVFVARFSHETNTFHPQRSGSFYFAEASAQRPAAWQDADLVLVRGVSATPAGGGVIEQQACRDAMNRILTSLREAMPVSAVFLRLHGGMFAAGVGAAETVLVEEMRRLVGPEIPIACTFDLHGNLPARMGEVGSILVGHKTAPHTDTVATEELAARILLEALRGDARPVSYVLPVPIILPGEKAMTTGEPFRSLVDEARRIEREGVPGHSARILAATIFVGCAWADAPHTGAAVVVTADGSRAAARAAAVHLAKRLWQAREQFDFGCETAELEAGVERAVAARESTVFLTDSGDNVTANAPGDLPIVLRHLVERGVERALVAGIREEAGVRRCFEAGQGSSIQLRIGASVEHRHGPPLAANVTVVRLVEPLRMAVVRVGPVDAILSERPVAFTEPAQFQPFGIDPLSRKLVVVKEGYLHAGLARVAPRHIMLLTPGAGDMRIERLAYARRRKPMFPFEPNTTFDAEAAAPA